MSNPSPATAYADERRAWDSFAKAYFDGNAHGVPGADTQIVPAAEFLWGVAPKETLDPNTVEGSYLPKPEIHMQIADGRPRATTRGKRGGATRFRTEQRAATTFIRCALQGGGPGNAAAILAEKIASLFAALVDGGAARTHLQPYGLHRAKITRGPQQVNTAAQAAITFSLTLQWELRMEGNAV